MVDVITSSFTQGAVWAILGLGAYVTFRLLNIADLSAEGVFPLGGAIAAMCISQAWNPYLATGAAFLGGLLAGSVSGWLHTKLHIPPIITGIMMQTGLYSINLRVMGGRPNIPLIGQQTIYTPLEQGLGLSKNLSVTIVAVIAFVLVAACMIAFLNTETGLALRATGDNLRMSEANGVNTNWMKTLGYMLSNGLIALCGAMVAQKDGFADISMGIGTIVIALASIVIAEVIIPNRTIGQRLLTILLGSFIYRLIIDTILNQNLIQIQHTDIRLFSAILLGVVLFIPTLQRQIQGQAKRIRGGHLR